MLSSPYFQHATLHLKFGYVQDVCELGLAGSDGSCCRTGSSRLWARWVSPGITFCLFSWPVEFLQLS